MANVKLPQDNLQIAYLRSLMKNRKIYIWGAWHMGCLFEQYLQETFQVSIEGYLDSNPDKENTYYNHKPVNNPSIIRNTPKSVFVFISLTEYASVRDFLNKNHYVEFQDYLYCGKRIGIRNVYNYQDLYGNILSGQIKNSLLSMTFQDCVTIGKGVTFGENVKINMGGFSNLIIEDNVSFGSNITINVLYGSKMIIGTGVKLGRDSLLSSSLQSNMTIGAHTSFMMHCTLFADNNTSFLCGEDCMFSHDILAHSSDGNNHVILKDGMPVSEKAKNIRLAGHVWIGMGARLLPGTEIGSSSIVGAASLVNKSFGDHVSIAGTPAKVISENVNWQR